MTIDDLSRAAQLLLLHICEGNVEQAAAVAELALGEARSLRTLERETGVPRSTLARRAGAFRASIRLSAKTLGLDPLQASVLLARKRHG
jgi:hypothetical protein